MSAAAAGNNKDASVGLLLGLQIRHKLTFSKRMAQSLLVLLEGPIRGIFVHICPVKAVTTVRRIPEIINIMSVLPKTTITSAYYWFLQLDATYVLAILFMRTNRE